MRNENQLDSRHNALRACEELALKLSRAFTYTPKIVISKAVVEVGKKYKKLLVTATSFYMISSFTQTLFFLLIQRRVLLSVTLIPMIPLMLLCCYCCDDVDVDSYILFISYHLFRQSSSSLLFNPCKKSFFLHTQHIMYKYYIEMPLISFILDDSGLP